MNLPLCQSGDCSIARTDYAANAGNATQVTGSVGPLSTVAVTQGFDDWITDDHNGIMFQRSTVKIAQITDGTSKTALIGEKYVSTDHYDNGECNGDDQNIFVGHDQDNVRYTGLPGIGAIGPAADAPQLWPMRRNDDARGSDQLPGQTGPGDPIAPIFGAAHPGAMNMAFCDGSVQTISYDVEPQVYFFYGGRNDDADPYLGTNQ